MIPPIPLEEAWQRLFALVRPLSAEVMPVDETAGRYLAEALAARRTQPDADLSAMDGFATSGASPWRLVGEARAGAAFAGSLGEGQAVRISTGAACPAGTQGIVVVEDGAVNGEMLAAPPPEPGRFIRRRGFDFGEGAPLLPAGTQLGPAQIALARMAGYAAIPVARRPTVAIVDCGDELVADPQDCPPGRLPATNGAMIAAMVETAGAVAIRIGPLPDDRMALADAFQRASDAEVLVTTAGASVGEHDHVRGALADCGADLAFWRVAIRPGKPLMVGRLDRQLVLGLPGNPASSFVTAWLFLLPLLRALQGGLSPLPVALPLPLTAAMPAGGNRREFMRGQLRGGQAVPLIERDSSALLTLATADLLIDRPIHALPAPAGAFVPCYWLGNGGNA